MKKWKVNFKKKTMKEQDLKDKINIEIVNYTTGLDNYSHTLDKCVQIAKDYAESQKEQEAIEFGQWMHENTVYSGNGFYSVLLGFEKHKHNQKLTECYQLFKNRENER